MGSRFTKQWGNCFLAAILPITPLIAHNTEYYNIYIYLYIFILFLLITPSITECYRPIMLARLRHSQVCSYLSEYLRFCTPSKNLKLRARARQIKWRKRRRRKAQNLILLFFWQQKPLDCCRAICI